VAREIAPCRGLTLLPAVTAVESLELARLCRHYICANSTFSFWSALLTRGQGGVTIAPRTYFNEAEPQAIYAADSHFYPPSWVRI
jgi:hypothetical protein